MSKKRYLKTWMGVTSGPTDYGYPERQIFIIEDLDTLVRTYNADADYYRLSSVRSRCEGIEGE